MKLDINQLDKYILFLQSESANLKKMGLRWATARAETYYDPMARLLTELRQEQQMTGMDGKRLDADDGGGSARDIERAIRLATLWRAGKMIGGNQGQVRDTLLAEVERLRALPRPDQEAIDAAPDLKGKKALVLYFETQEDVDGFISLYQEVHPKVRTVQL